MDVWQQVAAGDTINLLRNSLQVVQDESDAVGGVDDSRLGCVELNGGTAYLPQRYVGSGQYKGTDN